MAVASVLTCFHFTIFSRFFFVEENFSWLPSKNKVADENFLVKLQCSFFIGSLQVCLTSDEV
jgi:hypothetical protein